MRHRDLFQTIRPRVSLCNSSVWLQGPCKTARGCRALLTIKPEHPGHPDLHSSPADQDPHFPPFFQVFTDRPEITQSQAGGESEQN